MEEKETIKIPFRAFDSELGGFEYTIPEGYEVEIKDGKVIVRKEEDDDEKIRKALIKFLTACDDADERELQPYQKMIDWVEKHGEEKPVDIRKERRQPVSAKIKLMLCTDNRFFGPGVCELLEKIGETGSIQAAAARMELSYTKAWKILNRAEQELGTNLITRMSGGRNGGSSILTESGEKAVAAFREMEKKVSAFADEMLKEHIDSFRPEE